MRADRYPYRGQRLPQAVFDTDRYEKLDVEERYLAYGATILRLGFVYGEHDPQRREGFVLCRVRGGRPRIPFGSGSWIGSRPYVGDVGLAVERAPARPEAAGETFNICERRSPSVRLGAEQILRCRRRRGGARRVPDAELPPDLAITGAGQHLLASPAKAMAILDWSETEPEEAVGRSVRWHRANPADDAANDFEADECALRAAL